MSFVPVRGLPEFICANRTCVIFISLFYFRFFLKAGPERGAFLQLVYFGRCLQRTRVVDQECATGRRKDDSKSELQAGSVVGT